MAWFLSYYQEGKYVNFPKSLAVRARKVSSFACLLDHFMITMKNKINKKEHKTRS